METTGRSCCPGDRTLFSRPSTCSSATTKSVPFSEPTLPPQASDLRTFNNQAKAQRWKQMRSRKSKIASPPRMQKNTPHQKTPIMKKKKKDSDNEDLQALPTSETPLEPFISQTLLEPLAAETFPDSSVSETPLEIPISESALELSIPETPLESHTSNPLLVSSTSQTTLVPQASESPLKPSIPITSISDIPLEAPTAETDICNVPEKNLIFLPSLVTRASASPSDNLKEDLLSESSSKELPEFEHLPKHFLSGSSTHVYLDTSAKQKEEAGEHKDIVDTSSDITAHTTQPGHQLGKKKRKNGIICCTGHSVVPAKQAELVEMAKAMHREQFGAQMNHLFQWEKDSALNAIQTGLYIGWHCPHYLWDCYRIGDESKCFCGHLLKQHQIISDISVPCTASQCHCLIFCFIPSRPEEVGDVLLRRRATFNPKAWRAQCRCKHSHEDHTANGAHPCRHHACDRCWEEHEAFFETEETRRGGGRPHGTHTVHNWHRPF
ncbi:protein FAM221B isoform X3 [Heterocephalus glaber]|uniref:Protein FAM221B isoform X3 n=1 Tax=Heterocephalus glaber TaxID=10181 RepID=A0AAX6QQC6_HETGA|nr:protein FAM221B isoform X3 [Heterocephalus glaber]